MNRRLFFAASFLILAVSSLFAQPRRKIIINQDCSGPGGSNLQTLALLIQSPDVEVLGITVVSGDQWRDEEVAHARRLLEIMGRTEIPVVPGAVFPLVRRRDEAQLWQARYGKVAYAGAWDDRWWHEPDIIPQVPERVGFVDVFRPSWQAPDIARQAVAVGATALWLQLGIASAEACAIAEDAGLLYVDNRCVAIEQRRLGLDAPVTP